MTACEIVYCLTSNNEQSEFNSGSFDRAGVQIFLGF